MADSFFGFNTSLTALLDDSIPDEPGNTLEEEDEEEYDALNDETFGNDAIEGDWEEDHEKLAEITEQSRIHRSSYNEAHDNEDLDLEASLAHLHLDELDDDVLLENGDRTKENNTPNFLGKCEVIDTNNYSCSAPSGFPIWASGKQDSLSIRSTTSSKQLPTGKTVCTVEELERGLIQNNSSLLPKPTGVLRVEDIERDLTARNLSSVNRTQITTSQDIVIVRNSQNALRGLSPGPITAPPPVLGINRGGPVNVPPYGQPMGLHPRLFPSGVHHPLAMHIQQQQNHRLLVGSAPNLLRFLPPPLMVQQAQGNKALGPQPGFLGENGLIRQMHHRGPNMPYRPGFQQMGPHGDQGHRGNQYRAHSRTFLRNNYGGFNRSHPHNWHDSNSGDHDEYAGLMTNREKQWLLNIQLLQLNTNKPYVDDYYFTVFRSRQPKTEKDKISSDGLFQRERRDSFKDREQRPESGTPRVYTPAQFENSLGKLQVVSVTAPRKIIDMDVVSPEGLDSTIHATQRDSRKVKQILLEIERIYTLLLQLEDIVNPLPEAQENVTEDKNDIIQKIVTALLADDRLVSIMCIRKGKILFHRLLPHLQNNIHLFEFWLRIFRGLPVIGRRDQGPEGGILSRLYPPFKNWIETLVFSDLLQLCHSIVAPDAASRLHPPFTYKFGFSALVAVVCRIGLVYSSLNENDVENWCKMLESLADAASAMLSLESLPMPEEPMDISLLKHHLNQCTGLSNDKHSVIEQFFTPIKKKMS